jgi:glycerate 2-kinase
VSLVVVAPNAFRGGPDSRQATAAMGEGVRSARPAARIAAIPLADGGDGTLDVLADRLQANVETVRVTGPAGSPTDARLALTEDEAIIESADAAGNRLLEQGQRDPFETSTFGVGELIRHALARGVGRIVVAVGGTGTIDVGAGALQALGVRFRDDRGSDLAPTPRGLAGVRSVDVGGLDARLAHTELVVLADVDSPLRDSARLYGPQKGLHEERRPQLESTLESLAEIAQRTFDPPYDLLRAPMLGAGGGLPAGLGGFLGASVVGGADYVARRAGLPEALAGADALLTGEGRLDSTSFLGKAPGYAVAAAHSRGIRSCVFTGQVAAGADQHLPATSDCVVLGTDPGRPPQETLDALREAAASWTRTKLR